MNAQIIRFPYERARLPEVDNQEWLLRLLRSSYHGCAINPCWTAMEYGRSVCTECQWNQREQP